jgi:hypothetical protein
MARAPFGNFVAGLGPNMRRNIGNTIAGSANPMAPGFGGTAKRPNASGVPFVGAGNPMTQSGQMGTMNTFNMTPMPRGGAAPMGRPPVAKPPMFGGGAPPQWMPGAGGGMTNPNIPGPGLGAGGPAPMGGSGSAMGGTGSTNPNIPGPPIGAGGPNPMTPVDPYAGTGGGSPVYQPPGTGGLDPLPQTPTTGGEDPVFNPYGGTGGGLPPANPLNKGGGGGRRNPFQPNLTQFGQRPSLPPMGMMQRDGRAAGAPAGPGAGDGHTVTDLGPETYTGGGFGSGPNGEYTSWGKNQDRVPELPPGATPYTFNPNYQNPFNSVFSQFSPPPWNGPGPPPAKPSPYPGAPPAKPQPGPPLANPYRNIGGLDLAPGRRGGMGNTAAGMALGNGTIDRGQIGYGPDSLFSPNSGIAWGSDPYGYGGSAQDSMNGYGAVGSGFANAGYGSPSYGVNPTTAWNEQNSAQREGFSYGGYGDTGGATNGGGKVVCTAMNEAYGFGSFRQAIWLKHSAGLDPAYQRGYHAMFVPLLRFARGGQSWPRRLTWRALQHIARHRTADIWLQSKGAKRDTLGMLYRALLEPLCFVVGKVRG